MVTVFVICNPLFSQTKVLAPTVLKRIDLSKEHGRVKKFIPKTTAFNEKLIGITLVLSFVRIQTSQPLMQIYTKFSILLFSVYFLSL